MQLQKIKIIKIEELRWNDGELNYPSGICLNRTNNRILVCDMYNQRVVWMDIVTREKGSFPVETTNGKILDKPLAICCSEAGNMYVTDAGHNCIYLYGSKGWIPIKDGFRLPGAIAVDSKENLYVSNFLNNTIVYLNDDREWAYLNVAVDKPYGLCCDSHRLYITSTGENQLIEYQLKSKEKNLIFEDFSTDLCIVPIAVTVDEAGNLYICEQRRLLFYNRKKKKLAVLFDREVWKNEMKHFQLKFKLAHIGSITVVNEGCFFLRTQLEIVSIK